MNYTTLLLLHPWKEIFLQVNLFGCLKNNSTYKFGSIGAIKISPFFKIAFILVTFKSKIDFADSNCSKIKISDAIKLPLDRRFYK